MTRAIASNVRSMTGQGNASGQTDFGTVRVELRAVNNRGLKVNIRTPEPLSGIDSKLESVVREHLRRGSINLAIALESNADQAPLRVNEGVLAEYVRQFRSAIDRSGRGQDPGVILNVAAMGSFEGVLTGAGPRPEHSEALFEQVRSVLTDALEKLVAMRRREGANMAETLLAECGTIHAQVRSIQERAPEAAEAYRARLDGKVRRLLAQYDISVDSVDLLREIQVYADKADVSEELTRLESHLDLFRSVLGGAGGGDDPGREEPTGRKLDFIIQEMFRETNTIGSKSASAAVSAIVVEIKCAVERMRELVQNLE